MNIKDKMQMLCMKNGTTAEGYSRRREPMNIKHSSTESVTNSGHCERTATGAALRSYFQPTTASQSGINRKSNSQGVQRHRFCSKQRWESTEKSYGEQCLEFTTENDKEQLSRSAAPPVLLKTEMGIDREKLR
ncbi:hypothetical protein F511_15778 [Dorcoceras hygrometricum]|nr:hypothetical protein F511_15778 [Dorcoceras hygrometricum]